MSRISLTRALAFLGVLLLAPPGTGHSVFEAQELELHVINDEGTDAIDAYGGYDITEVFLGGIHHDGAPAMYLRIELYGGPDAVTGLVPWTVTARFTTPNGPAERFLSTLDGTTFVTDFDHLDVEVEGTDVRVHRAVVLLDAVGLAQGAALADLVVESRHGDDLRDIAPGRIPVPGTNGALLYDDPLQIDGQGRIIDAPAIPLSSQYVGDVRAHRDGTTYVVEVQNGLRLGGQHLFLRPASDDPAWSVEVDVGAVELEANATGTFRVRAEPVEAAAEPLRLLILSDVGGRDEVEIHPNGAVTRGERTLLGAATAAVESPPATMGVALVALVALAVMHRRRR